MTRIHVVGAALPGLAAAARLAKAGHDVVVWEAADELGGRWRDDDLWPASLALPAAWKDLFHKSGRILDADLATRHVALVAAPPEIHLLPDGRQLRLPTTRAEQATMVRLTLGEAAADTWQAILDRHGETWQTLRRLGLEADEPTDRAARRALGKATLADEAAAAGAVAPLLTQLAWPQDPAEVCAHVATLPWVDRTFGRWEIVDGDQRPVSPRVLVDALASRVRRRCDVHTGTRIASVRDLDGIVVDTTSPFGGLRRPPRDLRPALSPTVTAVPDERRLPTVVDHAARTIAHSRWTGDGWRRIIHDYSRPLVDPSAGVAWAGMASFRRRPALVDGTTIRAHAASRAGGEPWQQLLTAALASYVAHERAGGASIRPVDDPRKRDRADD